MSTTAKIDRARHAVTFFDTAGERLGQQAWERHDRPFSDGRGGVEIVTTFSVQEGYASGYGYADDRLSHALANEPTLAAAADKVCQMIDDGHPVQWT